MIRFGYKRAPFHCAPTSAYQRRDRYTFICALCSNVALNLYEHIITCIDRKEKKAAGCNHVSLNALFGTLIIFIHSRKNQEKEGKKSQEVEPQRGRNKKMPYQIWAKSDSFVSNSNKLMCVWICVCVSSWVYVRKWNFVLCCMCVKKRVHWRTKWS